MCRATISVQIDNVLVPPSLRAAVAGFKPEQTDQGSTAPNIVETAVGTDSLKELVAALNLPGQQGVLDALGSKGPFTVLAPTNGGFDALKTLKDADGMSLYDFVTKGENAAVLVKIA